MARVIQDVCDGCGEVRGTTNHWWAIRQAHADSLMVAPFHPEKTHLDCDVQIFCGEVCATKRISGWMSDRSQAGERTAPVSEVSASPATRP
jgi:hypothetical protein